MKRIFKEFVKAHKEKIDNAKTLSFASVTVRFNKWVTSVKDKNNIRIYKHSVYANKHVIRKWCKEMDIKERT